MLGREQEKIVESILADTHQMNQATKTYLLHWADDDLRNKTLLATASVYDLPFLVLLSPRRYNVQVIPKTHICRILYIFEEKISLNKLSMITGKKEHTSILNMREIWQSQIAVNKNYRKTYFRILKMLQLSFPEIINEENYLEKTSEKRPGFKRYQQILYNQYEHDIINAIALESSSERNINQQRVLGVRPEDRSGKIELYGSSV
jgi:hypothetical protein